jgi:hypothetical protein
MCNRRCFHPGLGRRHKISRDYPSQTGNRAIIFWLKFQVLNSQTQLLTLKGSFLETDVLVITKGLTVKSIN